MFNEKFLKRFWSKVKKKELGCWEWTGSCNEKGYGLINKEGKTLKAHRVSFEIYYKINPLKECILHSCDNPKCVNPEHLSKGSHSENMKDRAIKERTGNLKLKNEDVFIIREKINSGFSTKQIAKEFNISMNTVYDIKFNRRRIHI